MIYEVEAQELKRKIRDTEWQIVLLRREIREEEEMRKEDLRRRVAISTDIARKFSLIFFSTIFFKNLSPL